MAADAAGAPTTSAAWRAVKPFVNGGSAGIVATCCIQPIDIVKVRIQLAGTGSPLAVAGNIVKNEGFVALYSGLSAAIMRQATYTTARLGLFSSFNEKLIAKNDGKPLPLWQKAGAGLAAGGLGAIVGSPADLSLIRMQAKEMLKAQGVEGKTNVLGAAAIAGFFASAFSLPFDFVKTQLQKQQPLPDGSMPYKGMTDCAMKTVSEHGHMRFYAGFPTYYVRIAPHCMITLVALDYIRTTQAKNGW